MPIAPVLPPEDSPESLRGLLWRSLKTCYDPEVPMDIVGLGLVFNCDVLPMEDGGFRVAIKMTLTAPGCGMGEMLVDEIHEKLLTLRRVGEVDVEFRFDPPWDRSRMSETALLTLGL